MKAERWRQIDVLFKEALERPPGERASFLLVACGQDDALRRAIEALLASDEDAASFIDAPAYQFAASLIAGDDAPSLIGEKLGHYQIVSILGRGGMGEVYRARDLNLNRHVAVKVLPKAYSQEAERLRRFEREAHVVSALNHPNIITIHEIGEFENAPFIVTECVEGETLRQIMAVKRLSLDETLEVTVQVANALVAAHAAGVIHRDIKPENVMVRPDRLVKVLDFGLAKLSERPPPDSTSQPAGLHEVGLTLEPLMGTPQYMSPEQARGEKPDERSDLFSLGVMLYEMTTGVAPFKGDTSAALLAEVLNHEPPSPRGHTPDLPIEFEEIIRHALEKDRELRTQSAQEMLTGIRRLQQNLSVGSPPAEHGSSARRLSWAVLALVPIVLLAAFLVWRWRRPPEPLKVSRYSHVTNNGAMIYDPYHLQKVTMATDGERLYYSALINGRLVLKQTPTAGGESVTLPTPSLNTLLLDISPDRSELLAAAFNGIEREAPLYKISIPGGSLRPVGDILAHAAAWSPDGDRIAYAKDNDLYLTDNNGQQSRKIASVGGVANLLRWSPDGSRLRFTLTGARVAAFLWEVNADGSDPHPLLPGWNPLAGECCGKWTADGKRFVFHAERNSWTSLWTLEGTDRTPTQLTFGPLNFRLPTFSVDGRRIFAVGDRPRGELIRYDKGKEEWVPHLPGLSAQGLNFSRDGKWMAYTTYPEFNIWRSRTDGTERLQLTFPPMRAYWPQWSPDGKQIAFTASLPGKMQKIHLVSADGGAPQLLTPEDRFERDQTWSPDGSRLAFCICPGVNGCTVNFLDLNTRQISQVPSPEMVIKTRLSPDGRYLTAITDRGQKLILLDLSTRQWSELTSQSVSYPMWSRDSKYIYFYLLQRSAPPIMRVRISDKHVEPWASLKGIQATSTVFGWWMGLAPDDSPVVLRVAGSPDIYALELSEP